MGIIVIERWQPCRRLSADSLLKLCFGILLHIFFSYCANYIFAEHKPFVFYGYQGNAHCKGGYPYGH
ncbi:hypothetical protein, partial [Serratia marcescens]|uniref:hypothetical protein n=1 Tax=Serratia marcescens TaxID=615 RepID=UPI0027E42182